MQWNPEQYEIFKNQRREPFDVLLGMVEKKPGMRVVDLGCGTGEWTRAMHLSLGASETTGVDTSEEMLAQAKTYTADGLSFARGDIGAWASSQARSQGSDGVDLIFSNAALQWVERPREVLGDLLAALPSGGQIAVQVPWQDDYPSHAIAAELARTSPYREALGGWVRQTNALPPREYAALLDAHGMTNIHVRLQVFGHHLPGRDALLEWVEGSLLRSYAAKLPEPLMEQLRADYRKRLAEHFPGDGPIYYPFQRILFHARKPEAS